MRQRISSSVTFNYEATGIQKVLRQKIAKSKSQSSEILDQSWVRDKPHFSIKLPKHHQQQTTRKIHN